MVSMQKKLDWGILSSEYLFNDRWFKVRRDVCKTPGGKIVDPYYVYEFPEWCAAVPITEDGKVVMTRQYRHALGRTSLELPGGCVDDTDKDYEAAIARELLEETGYAFTKYENLGEISANPSTNNNLLHMFLATGGKKVAEQQLDPNEEIEVVLITIDELKEMVRKNELVQAMHVSCILFALERLGELRY